MRWREGEEKKGRLMIIRSERGRRKERGTNDSLERVRWREGKGD